MEKTKRKSLLSRQATRIASLKSKIRKPAVAKVTRTKAFASLEHLLNATALYRMGEYERASLAFQRAMAESDSTEMLDSLEDAQAQLEGGDTSVDAPETDADEADDKGDDYLAASSEDESGDDSDESDSDEDVDGDGDLDLLEDETAGGDVLEDEDKDFTVDPSDSSVSVAALAKKNLKAMKK